LTHSHTRFVLAEATKGNGQKPNWVTKRRAPLVLVHLERFDESVLRIFDLAELFWSAFGNWCGCEWPWREVETSSKA